MASTKELQPFRVSSGLKDLIGRDLITNDFVAVFELVKNAYDAHATRVHLHFSQDAIIIADNGKGMSRDAILERWLFVAYSAKREGTEDENYRDKITAARTFAGAKGVGRFSCDRLGSTLTLSSRAAGHPVQLLEVDWKQYEGRPRDEFGTILVELSEIGEFPDAKLMPPGDTGTVLNISGLRGAWDRSKLQSLKRELAKLIDPFGRDGSRFQISFFAPEESDADTVDEKYNKVRNSDSPARTIVNGPIENNIIDVVGRKTTSIHVNILHGDIMETSLEDRGELIYRIQEPSPYPGLTAAGFRADIYFLNRSAKSTFAHRMGIPSVQFGSIFVFRNGFRVFPIGAEDDDFFSLNQRKQQGQRRFLGGRDVIGRVDVLGVQGFDEATSRDGGLIRTPEVEELITCVRDKCIRRLERYVVDITWKDKFDKEVGDLSRMMRDESSSLIGQLVARLAATDGVTLIEYNPDLVRIVDEKSSEFEASLGALELLADRTGDPELLKKVDEARARIKAIQEAEATAREAERRAESRAEAAEAAASVAEARYGEERERNAFLVAAGSLDHDTILNLHHQIIIHASSVHHGVKRMMGLLRGGKAITNADWTDFLERMSFRNSQILTAARFATKGGYKQQSAETKADLSAYIRDYIEIITNLWAPQGLKVQVSSDEVEVVRTFRPIEIGIVVDNLVTNAAKAKASIVSFGLSATAGTRPELVIEVADDGNGWPESLDALERVFEKGITTTDGSGLGLYHVKQVIEGMRGVIEAHAEPLSEKLDGAHLRIRVPS
ncbi:signal transduction histidine kinase [Aminobacter aminovorans]|uniref:histidine kinase n=1 Tax=Aminobacter aminovorans TaxID=83263 RepID=A0A380WQZ6_AMIAI|nr:sensor histidine kinase [Aminobacter aminovorans]TCS29887.1 signal transduction histidine kinase [Aminobacter aminovorans]SUU90736.1 sensory histidine kinase DcuS [Aminobacter aminovorans]